MENEKLSLWALEDRLKILEEGINQADDNELEVIVGEIGQKVDSIKFVIDLFEKEAELFKTYKDQMANRQKCLLNAVDRLKSYVIKCLESHNTNFELGEKWVLRIKETTKVETKIEEPSASHFMSMAMNYPGLIKVSYSWDKNRLKSLLKEDENNDSLREIGSLVRSKYVQFDTVNKASKGK
jgi:hypothetical protein